jgi:hypothetical protein
MLAKITPRFRRGRMFRGAVVQLPLLAVLGCATRNEVPVAPSEIVLGSQGTYSLLLMTSGWTRVAAGAKNEFGADLLLSNAKAGVTVAVNVNRQPELGIDGVVHARRETLAERNEILSFEEERSFLERSDFVPVSVVRYRLRGKQASAWYPLLVGTARGPESIVEILAVGVEPTQLNGLFEDVLSGLRLPSGSVAAP